MSLRDLIFGRRNRVPTARDAHDPALAPEAATAMTGVIAADPAENGPLSESLADSDGPDRTAETPPAKNAARPAPGLILGQDLPPTGRTSAVVAELSGALSLRSVALSGVDRSARFLAANRRILAVRLVVPDQSLDLDLRQAPATEDQATAMRAAFEALLSAPVDLVVETRNAAGIFAADAGLPINLLVAEEAELRAAFAPPDTAQKESPPDAQEAGDIAALDAAT